MAMKKLGTIALDIDGTITDKTHMIPDGVASYFKTLSDKGWQFLFVTGRMFSFAMTTLTKLDFPYYLAVQNGADLLKMPDKKRVGRSYLTIDVVHFLDDLYQGQKEDFLVYAGYEKGDFCYYRPKRFSQKMLTYFDELKRLCFEPWRELDSFDIHEQSTFPLIKCIGGKETLEVFDQKLLAIEGIKTSIIRDPIDPSYYLILITHKDANKGTAVKKLMQEFSLPSPVITGGDDNNDIPLLKVGDVKIAMDGAPEALLNLADVIAPPADRSGIIPAIEEAINRVQENE